METSSCCLSEDGKPCRRKAAHRVTEEQLQRALNAPRAKCSSKLACDCSGWGDSKRGGEVCEHHAFDVIKPHIREKFKQASGNDRMQRRDFVMAVLEASGTHESQTVVEEPVAKRRRATYPSAERPKSVDEDDELMRTFKAAHSEIQLRLFLCDHDARCRDSF